ncbi:MAG: S8 family serine peptidase [Planctomycetes bacterium]|nr:S8 family serine peptidase [Planctomycetota bacterium]
MSRESALKSLTLAPAEAIGLGDQIGSIEKEKAADLVFFDGDPIDPNLLLGWHGTHIAGTLGAVGNNGTGIVGVNWQTAIVPLKVVGSENPDGPYTTPVSRVLAALDYIIVNKIKVANLSVTAGAFSAEECEAIAQAGEQVGHIFVVAAGNTNKDLDVFPEYPAACEVPNIITWPVPTKTMNWLNTYLVVPEKLIYPAAA